MSNRYESSQFLISSSLRNMPHSLFPVSPAFPCFSIPVTSQKLKKQLIQFRFLQIVVIALEVSIRNRTPNSSDFSK